GIAVPFRASPAPPDLWSIWDAIRCPTLLLRGVESDLLSAATATQMTTRGPRPALFEFAGVGHAPMLLTAEQIDPVLHFLRAWAPAAGGGREKPQLPRRRAGGTPAKPTLGNVASGFFALPSRIEPVL